MDSSSDFSYVAEGLQNVKKGDSNRAEIYSVICEFKNAVKVACLQVFGRNVSFENPFQDRLVTLFPKIGDGVSNAGNVTVHLNPCTMGFSLFRYELSPIMGYPVTLLYGSKSVKCSDKDALLSAIHDAYNSNVRALRNYCIKGGLGGRFPFLC